MSKLKSLLRGRRRTVLVLGALAGSALVLSSCVSTSGPYNNDHYTMSINRAGSANILVNWNGPACNQDVDRDGTRGTPHDRALCAFFVTRGAECNHADGIGQSICNAATEANGKIYGTNTLLTDSFTLAATQLLQTGRSCLQVKYGAFGDVKGWQPAYLGAEGCIK